MFNFETNNVRVVMKDGEPWFIAKDVCDVLEFGNSRDAISRHLDDDERDVVNTATRGGNQTMTIISESGLYSLIMRSSKPKAKQFRKWINTEVLPAIRKHGVYMTPEKIEEVLFNPDMIIGLAMELKKERALNERNKPKVQ